MFLLFEFYVFGSPLYFAIHPTAIIQLQIYMEEFVSSANLQLLPLFAEVWLLLNPHLKAPSN